MKGTGIADYEATMKVKVTKANGEVYEVEASKVDVNMTDDLDALIREYKAITKRAKEIELILLSKMIGAN